MGRVRTSSEACGDTRGVRLLLAGILVLGFVLRICGIGFGLPYLYYPDEPGKVIMAQRVLKTGDLNLHYFKKPSLMIYLNALLYVPYYLFGRLARILRSPADIAAPITLGMGVGWTPMPSTFLLGRALTACFSSASVGLLFLVGKQLGHSAKMGLLAALMLAVSPISVKFSHWVRTDEFLVFFAVLCCLASGYVLRRGKPRDYILAGVAAGLAASSKYNGGLVAVSVVSAHLLRSGVRGLRDHRLYLALASTVITFFVLNPYIILDYQLFLDQLSHTFHHYSTGHAGMEGDTTRWYLMTLWQTTGPVGPLAAVTTALGIWRRSSRTVLLSVFPLVYFAFIGHFSVRNSQSLLPMLPHLFVLASSALVELRRKSGEPRPQTLAISALAVACVVVPFTRTAKYYIRLTTLDDSREAARQWISRNIPVGARIGIESYAPYVDPQRFEVQGFFSLADRSADWYRRNGFDYLVFSEGMFGRYYRERDRYATEVSQYQHLFENFNMVKKFPDDVFLDLDRFRVEIRIYEIDG